MKQLIKQPYLAAARKVHHRALLPSLIACALATSGVNAQSPTAETKTENNKTTVTTTTTNTTTGNKAGGECVEVEGNPAGLYVTSDEGRVYVVKGDQFVELAPGDAAFADENKLTCIKRVPDFLDWPCSSDAASARKFATYEFDDLDQDKPIIEQVVQRYFEIPEVIEPVPNWLENEFHTRLGYDEIIGYSSPEYWYQPDPSADILNEKRPKTLLISLYVGINQVVLDNYAIDALHKHYGSEKIPVMFVFNDSNVVPVSYFGSNVSLEEVEKAFDERKIKLAEVPLWPQGDFHFAPTAEEFEKYFHDDMPDYEDIDDQKREAIEAQLETFGFSRKPIFVTMLRNTKMYVDDPVRLRIAIEKKMPHLQTVINFVEEDSHLARCGPGTPVGTHGVSGATTPIGGSIVPPAAPAPPPPAEPASGS